MKLIRFRENGKTSPGLLINDLYYDASPLTEDYTEDFFSSDGLKKLKQLIDQKKGQLKKLSPDIKLDCPIARPSKIICIGLNYSDHANETGAALPSEPIIFLKSTTAVTGPNDDIIIPKNSKK